MFAPSLINGLLVKQNIIIHYNKRMGSLKVIKHINKHVLSSIKTFKTLLVGTINF